MSTTKTDQSVPYLLFVLILSLFAVGSLTISTFFPLPESSKSVLVIADLVICVLFFIDFLITFYKAENKARYMITWGWLDLLSSIPAIPMFRWTRAARMLRILRVLRAVKATKVLSEFLLYRRKQRAFLAAFLISVLLTFFSAAAVLQFEDSAEGNIKTPGDAIWWAFVTITTVGYGDRFPLSTEGRVIGALLMTAGVGLFGTFSGFVAAWFLESPANREEESKQTSELAAITARLESIEQVLKRS